VSMSVRSLAPELAHADAVRSLLETTLLIVFNSRHAVTVARIALWKFVGFCRSMTEGDCDDLWRRSSRNSDAFASTRTMRVS